MKQLSSSRFRQTYLRETEPVEVTAYEKPIGYWYPLGTEPFAATDSVAEAAEAVPRFTIRPALRPRPVLDGVTQRVLDPMEMREQERVRSEEFQSRVYGRRRAKV